MIRRKLKELVKLDKYKGRVLTTNEIVRIIKEEFNKRIDRDNVNTSFREMKSWADMGYYKNFDLRKGKRKGGDGRDKWLVEVKEKDGE